MGVDDWPDVSLGDVSDLQTGYPFKSAKYVDDAGVRLLRGDNIAQGRLRWNGAKKWPANGLAGLEDYQLRERDVIVAMDRPWIEAGLKWAWIKGSDLPAYLVQRVARLRGRRNLDSDFLRYIIGSQQFTNHVLAVQTGTAVPHISGAQIEEFVFHLPPLAEQKAIAHVLGTLDDKIENNRRMNETLEAIARAIFKTWFVDFDPVRAKAEGRAPDGMDSDTAALFPDHFEDSTLGKIPAGWRAVAMPEAFEINPPRTLIKDKIAPYLGMTNMPTTSARVMDWEPRAFTSGMRFTNGDVLVARITPCLENGKTAYVDFLEKGGVGWGSTEYIVVRSKPPLPTEYAYFLARLDDFRAHAITNMTGTSGRQRVPVSAFNGYQVIVPPSPVADAFGTMAKAAMESMKQHDAQATTMEALRDALLPKLLSGEVRVKEADAVVGEAV